MVSQAPVEPHLPNPPDVVVDLVVRRYNRQLKADLRLEARKTFDRAVRDLLKVYEHTDPTGSGPQGALTEAERVMHNDVAWFIRDRRGSVAR